MNNHKFIPPPGFVPKTPRVLNPVESSEIKVRGLGDVIARATSAIGIKPCGGCKQRQEALNKLIPFNTNEPESKSDGTS
jgi:hypothetical protein